MAEPGRTVEVQPCLMNKGLSSQQEELSKVFLFVAF